MDRPRKDHTEFGNPNTERDNGCSLSEKVPSSKSSDVNPQPEVTAVTRRAK